MPLDFLRIAFAIALVFIVPGFLLVRALWPERGLWSLRAPRDGEADTRAEGTPGPVLAGFYTVVLSMCITTLVGVALGFLPHTGERGWLQTSATGAPVAEGTLVIVSIGLFALGYWRGAYPWLSREARSLERSSPD